MPKKALVKEIVGFYFVSRSLPVSWLSVTFLPFLNTVFVMYPEYPNDTAKGYIENCFMQERVPSGKL